MASCSKQGTHAIQDQILQNSVVSDQLWKILADTLYEVACKKDTQYPFTGKIGISPLTELTTLYEFNRS